MVPMAYIKNDLIPHLTSLYEEFSMEYEHMIIVFPKEVLPEKIKLPFDDYFLIVYRQSKGICKWIIWNTQEEDLYGRLMNSYQRKKNKSRAATATHNHSLNYLKRCKKVI